MQELQFDYYRGMEAEQYTFYRIPKLLFTAECFKSLSCEAKVLYGLLLDRMSLSIKNQWFDEEDRVYIIFTVEEIMNFMCCKTQKATKLLKELDSENGIGLIEKKRLGLGKPNVIYVKNFLMKETKSPKDAEESADKQKSQNECSNVEINTQTQKKETISIQLQTVQNQNVRNLKIETEEFPELKRQNFENQKLETMKIETEEFPESKRQSFGNQKLETMKIETEEFPESKNQNFENQKSGILKIETEEFPESKNQNFENQKSGILKIKNQEFRFSKSNNTDINDTDISDTEFSKTEYNKTDFNKTESDMYIPIYPISSISSTVPDVIEKIEKYRNIVQEQISYKCLQDEHYYQKEDIDELVELMVEVMLLPDNDTMRIAGVEKPVAIVKNQFMKLSHKHIAYILTCLGLNTTKVGNIKAYLLTTLYNAPMTISNYYAAEVNHNLYGSGELAR